MNKRAGLAVILAATCVAALVTATPVRAEDEDLDSTVYMVFDPDTGELITVEEPSGKKKPHPPTSAAAARGAQDAVADATDSRPVPLLLGGILALGLMGGAIAWIRRHRHPA